MSDAPTSARMLADAIANRLSDTLAPGEFDVFVDDGDPTIAMDEWSLHFALHPAEAAWLAIDSEPDDERDCEDAIRRVMPATVLRVLRAVDQETLGRVTMLLNASGDQLSRVLASVLDQGREGNE